ncbi:MAG TPA: TetR family transcriptional regulator [Ktedonobacterales bacterium]|nr:TetR family transcriptional regulator [Ktedonobacterales bacterium]
MPRTESSNQRIRDERREQILQAAIQVFVRQGYSAAKIANIAAAADTSHGLLYHYFPDGKEEIFAALIERTTRDLTRFAEAIFKQPGDAWDRLTWAITRILQGLQHQPDVYAVILQTVGSEAISPELRQIAVRPAAILRATLRQLIGEGQAIGRVVAGDPDELAGVLTYCIEGLSVNVLSPSVAPDPGPIAFPKPETLLRLVKA